MTPTDHPSPALARGTLDRRGDERFRDGLLASLRADEATRVLVLSGDTAPLSGSGALLWVAPADAPADAEWALLGRDAQGTAHLVAALDASDGEPFAAPAGWAGLRSVGAALSAGDAGAMVEAVSLARWLHDARFCPACGARAVLGDAGWSRRCPACSRQHFPRTDPAVIVAVTSAADPDRLLLGANAVWSGERYSCFAGFVEAGESLEAAVHRELEEEAGVTVGDLRYRGSQAWPYPRSLMLGFLATAVEDAAARPDGEEIVAVRWFTREEIGAALRGEGGIQLPGQASIAHTLISDWYAGSR
ncbi:NAD(+) diphosphatase [Microbacterium hominis]|uniref:NAD(+) diphosphatase n=1 Tax=Microbacterium hominis TaxID=162426 RepID=UPI0020B66F0E|nr:NAD(+) diphosphatase [Microbacterium hominis]